jgi:hypothetical protein
VLVEESAIRGVAEPSGMLHLAGLIVFAPTCSANAGRGLAQPDVLRNLLNRQAHLCVQARRVGAHKVLRGPPGRGQRRQVGSSRWVRRQYVAGFWL